MTLLWILNYFLLKNYPVKRKTDGDVTKYSDIYKKNWLANSFLDTIVKAILIDIEPN